MISPQLMSCAVLCWVAQSCPTLCDAIDCSPASTSVHGNSPCKNTGMGCSALLQGIFPTQGTNPGLPHCRRSLPSEPPLNGKQLKAFPLRSGTRHDVHYFATSIKRDIGSPRHSNQTRKIKWRKRIRKEEVKLPLL